MDTDKDSVVGLFGLLGAGGMVKGLQLRNVDVAGAPLHPRGWVGRRDTGGLVGRSYGQVMDCGVSGSVRDSGWFSGGLVGYQGDAGAAIRRCFFVGKVGGTGSLGGLVGDSVSALVEDSFAVALVDGEVPERIWCGFLGRHSSSSVVRAYAASEVRARGEGKGAFG